MHETKIKKFSFPISFKILKRLLVRACIGQNVAQLLSPARSNTTTLGVLVGKPPSLHQFINIASTKTMKVSPLEQKMDSEKKMPNRSKADQYLATGIHTFVVCLGLIPYKIKKETGEISFKWFSCKTILSLTRLVIFNFPCSILPAFFAFFGTEEWNQEEKSESANSTIETVPTATVFLASWCVEYISSFSYFILSRVAKSYAF